MRYQIFGHILVVGLFMACKGSETAPNTAPGTQAVSGQTETESSVMPANITGTFLACDYVVKPATGSNSATVGCRMADATTGHKYDLSNIPGYVWGYSQPASVQVAMTTPTDSASPWQAVYKLTGDYSNLQSLGTNFLVGLKNTSTATAYYQKVDNLINKLNFLMEGTWKSNQCLPYNASLYYMRTDIMQSGKYSTVMDYYMNTQCTGTPDWTETIIGLLTSVGFDGYQFFVDAKTTSHMYLPRAADAIAELQNFCPSLSFKVGVQVEGISCDVVDMEYTTLKFDENRGWIYTAVASDYYDGMSADRRKNQFDLTWYLIKQ